MQSDFSITYQPLGESTLLIEWTETISKKVLTEITGLQKAIEERSIDGVIDSWPAYCSLAVAFDPDITSFEKLRKQLDKLEVERFQPKRFRWHIPVCYGGVQGQDLEAFGKARQLSPEAVISLHTATAYTVHFIGFLPGFMYLGGLDEKLHLPRKATPDRVIPQGSVAIAGSQTGIYPTSSPGGWHVIGRTPVVLFDPGSNPPCFISPGDELLFEAIDVEKYELIAGEVTTGTYTLKKQQIHG